VQNGGAESGNIAPFTQTLSVPAGVIVANNGTDDPPGLLTGSYFFSWSGAPATSGTTSVQIGLESPLIPTPVAPVSAIYLTFYYALSTASGGDGMVMITTYNSTGGILQQCPGTLFTNPTLSWTPYTLSCGAPPGTADVSFVISGSNNPPSTIIGMYVDDISLACPLAPVAPVAPTPTISSPIVIPSSPSFLPSSSPTTSLTPTQQQLDNGGYVIVSTYTAILGNLLVPNNSVLELDIHGFLNVSGSE